MFSQMYDLFMKFLGYVSPVWDALTTKVKDLGIFGDDGGFLDNFFSVLWNFSFGWLVGISASDMETAMLSAFGEYSLLEFALGGSITVIVTYYIFKFIKGLIS